MVTSGRPEPGKNEEVGSEKGQKTSGHSDYWLDTNIKGQVIRADVDRREVYEDALYQYATSSKFNFMTPGAIVIVKEFNDHLDIKNAIEYAKSNKISLSVRSGGHQYLGYSSTTGKNIQIDMSNYKELNLDNVEKKKGSTIVLGVGWRLRQLHDICTKHKIFFPHGFCVGVALGGHCHTGGYGHFSHAFGLCIDYIQWFEIITADLKVRKICRPNSNTADGDNRDEDNDDLWFSVLGGSPGNFGVVTRVALKVLHDEDYPNSKALLINLPLEKATLTKLLHLYEKTADDPNLSHNVTFGIITESEGSNHRFQFEEDKRRFKNLILEEFKKHMFNKSPPHLKVFILFTGADGTDDGSQWFEETCSQVKDIANTSIEAHPKRWWFQVMNIFLSNVFGFDGVTKRALSHIDAKSSTAFDRVFNLPFQIRVWAGKSQNLGKRDFAEWASTKIMLIEDEKTSQDYEGIKQSCSFSTGGCKGSRHGPPEYPTALAHRVPQLTNLTFNMSYRTTTDEGEVWKEPLEKGVEWLDGISREAFGSLSGKFNDTEHRFLYAPFISNPNCIDLGNKNNNVFLDDEYEYYYDNKSVYERVLETKRKIDPDHVFTPNSFCVGYKDLPEEIRKHRASRTDTESEKVLNEIEKKIDKIDEKAMEKYKEDVNIFATDNESYHIHICAEEVNLLYEEKEFQDIVSEWYAEKEQQEEQ